MTEAQRLILRVGLCRLANPDETLEEILELTGTTKAELKAALEDEL